MMKALFSAIAGLQNHITMMDVVGNNIANVNTQGFKASRVTFQDMLTQNIAGASAPTADRGGTNPQQVGLGMKIGGIDTIQTQGSLQSTGRNTDLAIQGQAMFIVKNGQQQYYTRDGGFDVSVSGELVNPTNGFKVQGWRADTAGAVDSTQPLGSILIPYGQSIAAQPSTKVTLAGNVDSRVAAAASFSTTISVFDSLGASHPIELKFTKNVAVNTWDATLASTDPTVDVAGSAVNAADTPLTFDATGKITNPVLGSPLRVSVALVAGAAATSPIAFDVNTDGLTQFAAAGQVSTTFNDGYSAGALVSFSVGPGGDISGIFSNGTTRPIGQLALGLFTNPGGLQRAGSNNWQETANSGSPIVGTPGTGGRGSVGAGVLEGSNTDLAREFTNVVIAQRGFQASSKIITTADTMLNDLVQMIR
jgi:flagellar hook protein FlgE